MDPDPDPDPHQNVMDPQHWIMDTTVKWAIGFFVMWYIGIYKSAAGGTLVQSGFNLGSECGT